MDWKTYKIKMMNSAGEIWETKLPAPTEEFAVDFMEECGKVVEIEEINIPISAYKIKDLLERSGCDQEEIDIISKTLILTGICS